MQEAGFCNPEFLRDGDHSSGAGVATGLKQPTRSALPLRVKGRAILEAEPIWPCTGRGLPSTGSHLPVWWALTPPFHPYPAPLSYTNAYSINLRRCRKVAPGGLLSVALSLGSPPVAVNDLPALWCPDFPLSLTGQRPPCILYLFIISHQWRNLQESPPRNFFPFLYAST